MFRLSNMLVRWTYYNEPANPPTPPPTPPNPEAKFTQADIDRFVAEERRKSKTKVDETVKRLEELQTNVKLSEDEKANLQAQIDQIKNENLTKEQQLTRDLEKATKATKTLEENLTKEKDTWQGRYGTLLIKNQLTKAAADNDGFSADQFIDLLATKSKIVEVLDPEGKPSGDFKVVIKFDDIDIKTKQPVTLELDPDAVVKRMKELPERFGNLFKGGVNTGLGKKPGPGGTGAFNIATATTEEYRAYRKQRDAK